MAVGLVLNRRRQVPAEDTPAFGAIAERFRRGGDLERAVALCQEGLQKFPEHLSARVTLGWALLDLGRYDEAHTALEWVLKRAPDNLAAIRGMAELHQRAESAVELSLDGPGPWPPDQAAIEAAATAPKAAATHGHVNGARVDDIIEQVAAIDDAAPALELHQADELATAPDLLGALEIKSQPDAPRPAVAGTSVPIAPPPSADPVDAAEPDLELSLTEPEGDAVDLWESLKIAAPLDEPIEAATTVRLPVASGRKTSVDPPIAPSAEVVLDDFIGADGESADETAALLANLIPAEMAAPAAEPAGTDDTILLSTDAVDFGTDPEVPVSLDALLPSASNAAEPFDATPPAPVVDDAPLHQERSNFSATAPVVIDRPEPVPVAAVANAPLVLTPVPLQVDPLDTDLMVAMPVQTTPIPADVPTDSADVEVMADVLPMLAVDEPTAAAAIEDDVIELDEGDAFVLTAPSMDGSLGDVDAEAAAMFAELGDVAETGARAVDNLALDFDAPIPAPEPAPVVLELSPADAVPMPEEVAPVAFVPSAIATTPVIPVALGAVADLPGMEARFVDYSGATVIDTSMSSVDSRADRKKAAKRASMLVLEGMLRGIEVRRTQMAGQQRPGA
jgi:tetratricopeptide (TPR) repeat protein